MDPSSRGDTTVARPLLRSLRVFVAPVLAAVGVYPSSVHAQERGASLDTAVVRTVGAAIFGELSHALSRAAVDTIPRPWTITSPLDSQARWDLLVTHLVQALRARPPIAADTSETYIHIESVRVAGDTLAAPFTIGALWKCRTGARGGTSTSYEVIAVRFGQWWQPPRTRAVLFGDSAPCT